MCVKCLIGSLLKPRLHGVTSSFQRVNHVGNHLFLSLRGLPVVQNCTKSKTL